MKGDFSRETFRARRHYWGVLRQQGRVDLDADWNEQVRIGRHEHTARTADLVGASGGPAAGAGFGLTVEAGGVRVGAGSYYVAGILCENEDPVDLGAQPDPPGEPLPDEAGLHLAYLDVWDRHVTALDDPLIRETALGGPDTATRVRTVWQVRTQALADLDGDLADAVAALSAARDAEDEDAAAAALARVRALAAAAYCDAPIDPAGGSLDPGVGRLAARARETAAAADDPCRFEPEGGYQRLENRLYRVEIHDPGGADAATYKWSRDNGAIAIAVEEFLVAAGDTDTNRIRVRRLGFDDVTALREGSYVEVVADDDELAGRPGTLLQVTNQPDPAERVLELNGTLPAKDLGLHPKVRRWDMGPDAGLADVRTGWAALEDGLEVRFREGAFHTGDYWLIPARTATADVEWPPHPAYPGAPTGPPEDLPPMGVARHRAALAALVHDGDGFVTAVDLRRLFPSATALASLRYAGGDGQEPELPGGLLPQPLQVSVGNGDDPVGGALVRFAVVDGGGEVAADAALEAAGDSVTVVTGDDGVASVAWRLDVGEPRHRVMATRLDPCGDPTGPPVFFSARVNVALHHLSGDGQEGMPGVTLAPLRVWVSDGRWPAEGATVAFEITEGDGSIVADEETGPDGVATCTWTLGTTALRQQVTARLLDRDGDPVHEAAVAFNATLSVASQVAYAPAGDCVSLAEAETVQEALDELCRREQGGTCTFAVRQGTDLPALFERIQESDLADFSICFAEGTFEVDDPLVMAGKGHVSVSGAGRATRIVCRGAESVLRFERCASLEVRGLVAEARTAAAGDGLGGALTFLDCGVVTVDDAGAVCPSAPERRSAGITARWTHPGTGDGAVRIRHCDVIVGEQQFGILVVNASRSHVEDNTVRPGGLAEDERLADLLANPRYRARVRRKLVAFDEPAVVAPGHRSGTFPVRVAGTELVLRSELFDQTRRDVWEEEIAARNPRSVREAREAAIAVADTVLRNEGVLGRRRVFRDWFEELEARFAVTGQAGVVIGGTVAEDVRILHNSLHGVLRGVSVGLSDTTGRGHHAGVVRVEGNTLVLPGDSVVATFGDGVFVGNVESLLVADNVVRVERPGGDDPALAVDGVRVDGVIGARMVVRANHCEDTVAGVRVTPGNALDRSPRRWVAADNVATAGEMLVAPCAVTEDGNVPARPEPCGGDRPAGWGV